MNETLLLGSTAGDLASGVTLMIVGMGVVFGVLVLLSVIIALLDRQPKPKPEPASPTPAAPAGVPPAHLAAIAAAAFVALGPRARVTRVVFLGHSSQRDWVAGGRATVMGSHAPRGR